MHEHSQTWWNIIYRAIASTQEHAPRHPIKNHSASNPRITRHPQNSSLCLSSLSDVLNASKEEAHPKARQYPGCVWSEFDLYLHQTSYSSGAKPFAHPAPRSLGTGVARKLQKMLISRVQLYSLAYEYSR